ncbi:hypothetical protein BP00DRAFT_83646 [Aspergillus indologenus CBS 114.80]|uniref:Uncharacterized protein n=1 Tax=Aspergillus indologenus CBS 114.80 TaxID=1450541 RepID=A0A2V5J7Y5_9EURO|nr:hypothetical protein BP00DRAFT_83646 [Aspergillus indologenus CBS 114.80]
MYNQSPRLGKNLLLFPFSLDSVCSFSVHFILIPGGPFVSLPPLFASYSPPSFRGLCYFLFPVPFFWGVLSPFASWIVV